MRKLLPLILAVIGLGAGIGAGMALRPAPEHTEESPEALAEAEATAEIDPALAPEFARLGNQFVVPIVTDGRVNAMVVMSISLEVKNGTTEKVFSAEPRLRDAFLQVLFDHANAGGFRGSFTDADNLKVLRRALLESARKTLGEDVTDALIVDIMRQDS